MAQKIELQELFNRQAEIAAAADKLNTMNEGERILQEAKKIQQKAEELHAMALVYEAQEKARLGVTAGPPPRPGIVKVELTEEQQLNVQRETGVRIDVVELEEGRDVLASGMPIENPQVIELRAIEKARRMKLEEEAAAKTKAEAMAAAEEVAKAGAGNPELAALLAEKMKDPNFLGGLLQKK